MSFRCLDIKHGSSSTLTNISNTNLSLLITIHKEIQAAVANFEIHTDQPGSERGESKGVGLVLVWSLCMESLNAVFVLIALLRCMNGCHRPRPRLGLYARRACQAH